MRFSIRDLLLVTVIVALVLGWYLDHRWQKTELERTTEAQRKAESKLQPAKPAGRGRSPGLLLPRSLRAVLGTGSRSVLRQ